MAVVLVEGLILTVSAGKLFWHSPLIPVTFLIEGIITALAIMLIVVRDEQHNKLANILIVCLAMLLLFNVVDWITAGYMAESEKAANFRLLFCGSLSSLYWAQVILCIVVPLVLLLWRKGRVVLGIAGVLAIVGVAIAKINLCTGK